MKATKGKVDTRKGKKEELKPVVEDRTLGKRKAAIKADNSRKKLTKKVKLGKKDANKPKRPPSAFFVFLEEFRTIYKQEHPNVKAVSAVGKAGGEKWKSLSSAEKAPYEAKAAKRKSEYEKLIAAYNKKQDNTDEEEEESEKSKSNVNEDDEEETGENFHL
ncbi:high mobility group B protein 1 isoform X2 [Ziziphus jujuba]|uniref:High mobility group B protein 1 isoform X2 n=1 Tax=Ziziphus jujuba TaxID=326968 RepID=A0ABM4AH38_ZIZJJ|nr:high mobility group B protein 1 isoform X2 [Ziziphus jujuba]